MEPDLGYFCRAYVGQDVQANVIARTLREAELEITRMIRGGAGDGACRAARLARSRAGTGRQRLRRDGRWRIVALLAPQSRP